MEYVTSRGFNIQGLLFSYQKRSRGKWFPALVQLFTYAGFYLSAQQSLASWLLLASWPLVDPCSSRYHVCIKERMGKGEASWQSHPSLSTGKTNIFKSLSSRLLPTTKVVIFGLCGYTGGWESKYLAWGWAPGCLKGNWYPVSREQGGTRYQVGIR